MANAKRLLSLLTLCLMLISMPFTVLAEGEPPVATVTAGGTTTNYTDLQGAIDAAEAISGSDVTLKLLQSITGITTPYTVEAGSFTVDLNGCTLSSASGTVLKITGGMVEVTDSSSGNSGKLETSASKSHAVQVAADVKLSGGSFVSSASGIYNSDAAVSIASSAKLTVTGSASIQGTGNCNAINAGQDSIVDISGGTVAGAPGVDTWYSKLTVSGGTVNSLYLYGGTSTVSGGTVSRSAYLVAPNTTLNISGGTVNDLNVQNGTINMTGGTAQGRFAGVKATAGINANETAVLNITGGTITATDGPAIHLNNSNQSGASNTLNLGAATLNGTTAGVMLLTDSVTLTGIPTVSASAGPAFSLARENQLSVATELPANLSYTVQLGTTDGTGTFGTVASTGSASKTNFRAYAPGLGVKLENANLILAVSNAPTASIDYPNAKLTGLEANATYTVNGTSIQADANGCIPIDGSWYASDITIAKADSDEQQLHIPARPNAPAVTAVAESEAGKNDGKITGVDWTMEYRKTGETSWTAISESVDTLTDLEPGSYEVRVKATASSFAGEVATVTVSGGSVKITGISLSVSSLTMEIGETDIIAATVSPSNATDQTLLWASADASVVAVEQDGTVSAVGAGTTTITVSAKDGSGVETTATVTVVKKTPTASMFTFTPPTSCVYDGASKAADVTAGEAYRDVGAVTVRYYNAESGDALADAPVDAGTYQVKIDVAESDTYYAASDLTDSAWTFTVRPASQQMPTGITAVAETYQGENDGKILGVTAEMEYMAEGATAYTPITGDSVTDLAPGKYYVRYRGSNNYDPSEAVEVTVEQGAPKPTTPTDPTTPTGPGAPDTGDNASPILWIVIAAVSLLGGLVLLWLLLRPKKPGKYAA